jgi:LysM repeat protein
MVVLVVLLLANAVGAAGHSAAGPVTEPAGAVHLVVSGDTLWDIAAAHTAPGEDVRRMVFEIKQHNGLEGSLILPGQLLAIPVSR